jgi:ribonuclease Z
MVLSCNSTISEAVQCGVNMNAQFIILTHFSARYPKMPSLSNSFKCHTALAFDLMRVSYTTISSLQQFQNIDISMFAVARYA